MQQRPWLKMVNYIFRRTSLEKFFQIVENFENSTFSNKVPTILGRKALPCDSWKIVSAMKIEYF